MKNFFACLIGISFTTKLVEFLNSHVGNFLSKGENKIWPDIYMKSLVILTNFRVLVILSKFLGFFLIFAIWIMHEEETRLRMITQ